MHRAFPIQDKFEKYGNGLLLPPALPMRVEFLTLWDSPLKRLILLHPPFLPSSYHNFVPRRNSHHAFPLTKGKFQMI